MKPGPSLAIGDGAFKNIEHAVLSKVFLTQKNGEAELKDNDMISFISSLRESVKSSQLVEKDQSRECGRS
jgi:hypothetical protein